jgi:hypothetical protein
MKIKLALSLFALLLSVNAWGGTAPNAADYTINVHVTRARMSDGRLEKLNVVIDGAKYELEAGTPAPYALLALGDYKAKVVKDERKESYYSIREYEFLFPNNKTTRFFVVGQTE